MSRTQRARQPVAEFQYWRSLKANKMLYFGKTESYGSETFPAPRICQAIAISAQRTHNSWLRAAFGSKIQRARQTETEFQYWRSLKANKMALFWLIRQQATPISAQRTHNTWLIACFCLENTETKTASSRISVLEESEGQ